jgi:hypothetical protein
MTVVCEGQEKRYEEFETASKAISKPLAKIEKWAVVRSVVSYRFELPETGNRLIGYVPGSANLPSPRLIHTSPILRMDLAMGLVETRNTIYVLGEASEEYKKWSTAVRSQ